MRSLSSVIKSYQYGRVSAPEAGARPGAGEGQGTRSADGAFLMARQIVAAAQEYRIRVGRETAEESRREYEQARRRGYREGFAQGVSEGKKSGAEEGKKSGYEEGVEKAEAENRKTMGELSRMVEAVEKDKTDILRKFEDGIEELAFAMARAVLKRELSLDEDALRSIILSAADSYRNQAWVRIRVSEKDAGVLLRPDKSIAEDLKNVSGSVKVIPVPDMEDGSCVIEMPDQVIDAGIGSQLRKLEDAVESAGRVRAG